MITFFRKVIWRHRLDETVGTRSWSKNTKSIYSHNERYIERDKVGDIFRYAMMNGTNHACDIAPDLFNRW
jgi:hypothetical protein